MRSAFIALITGLLLFIVIGVAVGQCQRQSAHRAAASLMSGTNHSNLVVLRGKRGCGGDSEAILGFLLLAGAVVSLIPRAPAGSSTVQSGVSLLIGGPIFLIGVLLLMADVFHPLIVVALIITGFSVLLDIVGMLGDN